MNHDTILLSEIYYYELQGKTHPSEKPEVTTFKQKKEAMEHAEFMLDLNISCDFD